MLCFLCRLRKDKKLYLLCFGRVISTDQSRNSLSAFLVTMSTDEVALQASLRSALQEGSLAAVKSILEPQSQARTWKTSFRSFMRGQVPCSSAQSVTANLGYVYQEDDCNLPVHYLATGRPAERISSLLGLLNYQVDNHDQARAKVAEWLTASGRFLDVGAVNASNLDTGIHCSVRSHSPLTLQALLLMAIAGAQPLQAALCSSKLQDQQALDLAFSSGQWFAIQLLVQAGALQDCPALVAARAGLLEAMPAQMPPTTQPGLATIVSGVSKVFSALLGPTLPQPPPPSRSAAPQRPNPPQQLQTASSQQQPILRLPFQAATLSHASNALDDLTAADEPLVYNLRKDPSAEAPVLVLPDLAAVLQWRQAGVQQVASQCCVHESVAVLLLEKHEGSAESACQAWRTDPQGALEQGGMPAEMASAILGNSQMHALPAQGLQCMVCYEDISSAAGSPRCTIDLQCHHCTCDDCWQGIIEAGLSEGDVKGVGCPQPGCRLPLPPQLALSLLKTSPAQRYRQLLAQHHVDTTPSIKWCPASGCPCSIAIQCNAHTLDSSTVQAVTAGRAVDVSCSCGHAFCFACLAAAHEPAACHQVQQWEDLLATAREEDKLNAVQWVRHNTQPCPRCGAPIQRNGGCNHICCSVCRHHFCWACGGKWADHSNSTGGNWSCNLASAAPPHSTPNAWATVPDNASNSAVGSSSLFSALFSRVADAGLRWRLDHFMRLYLSQECSQRQLEVSAKWMAALLQSGLSRSVWAGHHPTLLQQQQQQQQQQLRQQSWSASPVDEGPQDLSGASSLPVTTQDPGLRTLLQGGTKQGSSPRHRALPSSHACAEQGEAHSSSLHATVKRQRSWPDQGHLSPQHQQQGRPGPQQQQQQQRQTLSQLHQLPLQAQAAVPIAQQAHAAAQHHPTPAHATSSSQQASVRHQPTSASQHAQGASLHQHSSSADLQWPDQAMLAPDTDAFAYLLEMAREVVAGRRVLQSSFVLGFYFQGSSQQQRLLQELQSQLTGLVEQVCLYLALLPGSATLLNLSPPQLARALSSVPTLPQIPLTPSQPAPLSSAEQHPVSSTSSRHWLPSLSRPGPSQHPSSSSTNETVPAVHSGTSPSSEGRSAATQAAAGPMATAPGLCSHASAEKQSMAAGLRSITPAHAPADGSLGVPGGTPWLQKQFMFAVAVHEQAHLLRQMLQQLKRAKQMLLHAGRTGAFASEKSSSPTALRARMQTQDAQAPSLAQVAQNVKYMWHSMV